MQSTYCFGIDRQVIRESVRLITDAVKRSQVVAVLTHGRPDPDAGGASTGVAELCYQLTGVRPRIFYDGATPHPLNLFDYQGEPLEQLLELKCEQGENLFLILVDATSTNNSNVACGLELPTPDLVLDHHGDTTNGRYAVIVPEVGSASGIVAAHWSAMIRDTRDSSREDSLLRVFTFLCLGVMTDNSIGFFTSRKPRTISREAWQSYQYLRARADSALLHRALTYKDPLFEIAKAKAKQNGRKFELAGKTFFVAHCGVHASLESHPHLVGSLASYLRDTEKASVLLVGAFTAERKIKISLRSPGVDFGIVARQVLGDYGENLGGGRKDEGAAELPFDLLPQLARQKRPRHPRIELALSTIVTSCGEKFANAVTGEGS